MFPPENSIRGPGNMRGNRRILPHDACPASPALIRAAVAAGAFWRTDGMPFAPPSGEFFSTTPSPKCAGTVLAAGVVIGNGEQVTARETCCNMGVMGVTSRLADTMGAQPTELPKLPTILTMREAMTVAHSSPRLVRFLA
jgi:hypothetical protein